MDIVITVKEALLSVEMALVTMGVSAIAVCYGLWHLSTAMM